MKSLANDPDIRDDLFSIEEKLTREQVHYFAARLRGLLVRYESSSYTERLRATEWSEWSGFIQSAYPCGFVCRDAGHDMDDRAKTPVSEFILSLEGDLARVHDLSLRDLRKILHHIIRSERWGDGGGATGGGAIWRMITSGLGDAVAQRLGS